jgi:hypothetical protein
MVSGEPVNVKIRRIWAHFLLCKKPGYPGLRYRSGPGAKRRGRFAPLLSLALLKNGVPAAVPGLDTNGLLI